MAFSGGDLTWLVYQGPPRWDGEKFVNGDKFFISGHKGYQGQNDLGVDMNLDMGGLERETTAYKWDTPAEAPSSSFVGLSHNRREITGSVNIYGNTAAELRENKNRWFRAHPDKQFGKLWAFSSNAEPRYLDVIKSETAGLGNLTKDPGIRCLYEKFEWGWVSENSMWKGYESEVDLAPIGGNTYQATFYNPSTFYNVYPVVYLPGPGRWTIDKGTGRGTYTTPELQAGEVVRIDYNPLKQTLQKRSATGVVENIWATVLGERPQFVLEPEAMNTYKATNNMNPSQRAKIVFTPLFRSWN